VTGPTLATTNPKLVLVPPNVERDAPNGVEWLQGPAGRDTLARMGVTDANNHPSTLTEERARIADFIENRQHLAWMMRLNNKIVGVVEVSFKASEHVPLPSISIMIGDVSARGQGLGYAALTAVVEYLTKVRKFSRLYARYLTSNTDSEALFHRLDFHAYGDPYVDADGLSWQNVQRES
jgi:RimJ/RimL family protein N-acetyltransferase